MLNRRRRSIYIYRRINVFVDLTQNVTDHLALTMVLIGELLELRDKSVSRRYLASDLFLKI